MRSRFVTAAVAAAVVFSLSGCLGIPEAAQLELEVYDDRIELVRPREGISASGETVITLRNYSNAEIELVLAETDAAADELPEPLVVAISPRDDDRIVAMTPPMEQVGSTTRLGLAQPLPSLASMHVYLEAETRYLLYDRLDGFDEGIAIELIPPG
jgi:hypothetical protein